MKRSLGLEDATAAARERVRGLALPGCLGQGREPHLTGVRRLLVRARASLEMTSSSSVPRGPDIRTEIRRRVTK